MIPLPAVLTILIAVGTVIKESMDEDWVLVRRLSINTRKNKG